MPCAEGRVGQVARRPTVDSVRLTHTFSTLMLKDLARSRRCAVFSRAVPAGQACHRGGPDRDGQICLRVAQDLDE